MGRFREVSKYISIPKYAKIKIKREKEKKYVMFGYTKCSPEFLFFFLVLHLEIAIVGVLALRIAVRMASIFIS